MTKRALLLINRHSRKGQQDFAKVVDTLNELEFELTSVPVKRSESLNQVVRQYAPQVDVVIVGGGDGTLNAVADSLVEMKRPLGILPLGTANDLARTLQIPLTIPEACRVIADGQIKQIDLGWVNNKHFFNVASLGLSVQITENLSKGAKRRWGILAYALSAIQVLSQTRPFRAQIRINDDELMSVRTIQIAVGNGRFYGGGMAIAEDAKIDDRRLDIYSLELEHWWQIFPLLHRLPQGQQNLLSCVQTFQGETVEILTTKPQDINTDGEITAQTPATFRVIPQALAVFVPSSETVA